MAIPPYERDRGSSDPQEGLERVQDRIEEFTQAFIGSEIVDGRLLEVVFTSTGSQRVPHLLRRIPSGYSLVKAPVGVTLGVLQETQDADREFAYLQTGTVGTFWIWVF